MYLEIVSPEATLFSSDVDAVTLPGVDGAFQIMDNHAPIVSILTKGFVKINVHTQSHLVFDDLHAALVPHIDDPKVLTLAINSGTIEMKDNKIIVLAD